MYEDICLTYSSFQGHFQVSIIKYYAGCIATEFKRNLEMSTFEGN